MMRVGEGAWRSVTRSVTPTARTRIVTDTRVKSTLRGLTVTYIVPLVAPRRLSEKLPFARKRTAVSVSARRVFRRPR